MLNENNLSPEQRWENATLANNFIFYKVMRHHPDACKQLIEMLLGVKILKMEMHNEESIDLDHDAKGIRLDVYVKDEDRMFDVEIQSVDTLELPERSRYYAALMSLDSLKSGQRYRDLKESHVIFICMEDIFDSGLPVYTFENVCTENMKTKLNDRDYKHFFIAPTCAKIIEDVEARTFFEFLLSNTSGNTFTSNLKNYVDDAKHNMQWRHQYMTYLRQRTYDMDKGREEGRAEGAHDARLETARKLLAKSIPLEIVIECTGLTEKEVSELKQD